MTNHLLLRVILAISSLSLSCRAFVNTGVVSDTPIILQSFPRPLPLVQPPRPRHQGCCSPYNAAIVPIAPTALRCRSSTTKLNLTLLPSGGLSDVLPQLFSYTGDVPVVLSVGLNLALFNALKSKLNSMLTPSGYWHAFALGCGLWATLGWRGWTVCVAYLFLGQAVTKVKFAEKEKAGIAESRGGRRGPENVW